MANPRVLIVDDEPLARQRLSDLIGDIGGFDIAGQASNGLEALAQLQASLIDIVLLDIRMPGMDGIELAQHLRGLATPPALIFTTAYDHYAVQAFELNAIDYLLKPIRAERLATALAKVKPLRPSQWQAIQPIQNSHSHLSIHERGKLLLVPIEDVLYFRAELKYVTVRTRDKSYLLDSTLNQLEQTHGQRFIRLHRNALVAKNAITGFAKQRQTSKVADPTQTNKAAPHETHWVALIKDIPDTIPISRRQQHVIKDLSVTR